MYNEEHVYPPLQSEEAHTAPKFLAMIVQWRVYKPPTPSASHKLPQFINVGDQCRRYASSLLSYHYWEKPTCQKKSLKNNAHTYIIGVQEKVSCIVIALLALLALILLYDTGITSSQD